MVKFVNLKYHYFKIIRKSKNNYTAILFQKTCIGNDIIKGKITDNNKIEMECWIGAMKEIYL